MIRQLQEECASGNSMSVNTEKHVLDNALFSKLMAPSLDSKFDSGIWTLKVVIKIRDLDSRMNWTVEVRKNFGQMHETELTKFKEIVNKCVWDLVKSMKNV